MPTYTLDGVDLNHPAGCWRLKAGTKRRPLPNIRAVEVQVPGRAGDLPIINLDHAATQLALEFVVTSASPSGGDGGIDQLEANLEALSALIGVQHRLMTLKYIAGAVVRVADVMIPSVSEPDYQPGAKRARLTAMVKVPGVYWRDESRSTWAGTLPASSQAVTALAGSTAPVTDALIRITGPATNPSVTDLASGGTVFYTGTVASGKWLVLDCGALRASIVSSDTWSLTPGTDVTGSVSATGPGSAFRWLHLLPSVAVGDPFSRVVLLTATASATTGASKIEVQARRSYL